MHLYTSIGYTYTYTFQYTCICTYTCSVLLTQP